MSRLLKSVARLEAAGAAAAAEPGGVGMCWTSHEARVDANELEDGEYIAADVRIDGDYWAISERVTLDTRDLGVVTDANGERLGIVVGLDGSLVTWRPDPPAAD